MGEVTKINGFDFDGVIHLHDHGPGVRPHPDDVIITGRSFQSSRYVLSILRDYGIDNPVFFNPRASKDNDRTISGRHKADTLNRLRENGVEVNVFFEDDPIQREQIETHAGWVKVVHLVHDLTQK
jgi:hypothetical protein